MDYNQSEEFSVRICRALYCFNTCESSALEIHVEIAHLYKRYCYVIRQHARRASPTSRSSPAPADPDPLYDREIAYKRAARARDSET